MREHAHASSELWRSPGLFNHRYGPSRYRTLDRNSNPDHPLFLDLNNMPGNRPRDSYCMEGTS